MSAIAAALAQRWTPLVCHYCGAADAEIDGDRRRWANAARNVCNASACLRRFTDDVAAAMPRPKRKRTPAEVSELIRARKRGRKRRVA